MAMLLEDEFPELDIDKVLRMCLTHDLGEAFTGDVPAFDKTEKDSAREEQLYKKWIDSFPAYQKTQFTQLLGEMEAQNTMEARLYKALDKMEAVIQHDEADISSWLPLEYELQLTYGAGEVAGIPYMAKLKEEIDRWTRKKIADAQGAAQDPHV